MCTELRLPSRTQAYNTVKGFLGIPKNALLNEKFFLFFYTPSPEGYIENMPEEKMESIIKNRGLRELNRDYHDAQQKNRETKQIQQEIFLRLREETENPVNPSEEPSLVRQ